MVEEAGEQKVNENVDPYIEALDTYSNKALAEHYAHANGYVDFKAAFDTLGSTRLTTQVLVSPILVIASAANPSVDLFLTTRSWSPTTFTHLNKSMSLEGTIILKKGKSIFGYGAQGEIIMCTINNVPLITHFPKILGLSRMDENLVVNTVEFSLQLIEKNNGKVLSCLVANMRRSTSGAS
ncbi:Uncharacterized protein Adt_37183 [Abeliophyllum distichum]|uniref:Uncharacterized protein n=1 Tax=Abeliophyllum distichum TaxID=126358 RepID=A0ABD1QJN6_9LAMI